MLVLIHGFFFFWRIRLEVCWVFSIPYSCGFFFLNISPFYFIPELSFSMSMSSLYALLNVDSLVSYFLGRLSHFVFLYLLSFTASLSSPAQDYTSDLWCFCLLLPPWFVCYWSSGLRFPFCSEVGSWMVFISYGILF